MKTTRDPNYIPRCDRCAVYVARTVERDYLHTVGDLLVCRDTAACLRRLAIVASLERAAPSRRDARIA